MCSICRGIYEPCPHCGSGESEYLFLRQEAEERIRRCNACGGTGERKYCTECGCFIDECECEKPSVATERCSECNREYYE